MRISRSRCEQPAILQGNNQSGCEQKQSDYLVRIQNNVIWFYDAVDSISLFKLKTALQNLNQSFDLWKIQFFQDSDNYYPVIHLHINSGGGSVTDGLHMYDIIKNNKYPVYTYVDGYVASAATLPFLAGLKRMMSDNSVILIHQLSNLIWKELTYVQQESLVQRANVLMGLLRNIYLKQMSITQKQLQDLLQKDLFLTYQDNDIYGFLK